MVTAASLLLVIGAGAAGAGTPSARSPAAPAAVFQSGERLLETITVPSDGSVASAKTVLRSDRGYKLVIEGEITVVRHGCVGGTLKETWGPEWPSDVDALKKILDSPCSLPDNPGYAALHMGTNNSREGVGIEVSAWNGATLESVRTFMTMKEYGYAFAFWKGALVAKLRHPGCSSSHPAYGVMEITCPASIVRNNEIVPSGLRVFTGGLPLRFQWRTDQYGDGVDPDAESMGSMLVQIYELDLPSSEATSTTAAATPTPSAPSSPAAAAAPVAGKRYQVIASGRARITASKLTLATKTSVYKPTHLGVTIRGSFVMGAARATSGVSGVATVKVFVKRVKGTGKATIPPVKLVWVLKSAQQDDPTTLPPFSFVFAASFQSPADFRCGTAYFRVTRSGNIKFISLNACDVRAQVDQGNVVYK